jgi:Protein of unknown function (DUF3019)
MRILAAALALMTFAASGAAAQTEDRRVTLTVKPVLCITDRQNESCALSILVVWRADAAGTFCLHNDLVEGPVRCWQRAVTGMVMEDRVVEQTFRYWLTDGTTDVRLAEATLDVMTAESDDRRRHRRRRHVWDIL